jgi:hypothetical protein
MVLLNSMTAIELPLTAFNKVSLATRVNKSLISGRRMSNNVPISTSLLDPNKQEIPLATSRWWSNRESGQ